MLQNKGGNHMYENITIIFDCPNSFYFPQFCFILFRWVPYLHGGRIYMSWLLISDTLLSQQRYPPIYASWLHLAKVHRWLRPFLLENHCLFSILNVFALRMLFLPNTKEQTICWHWVIQFSHTLNNLHPNTSSSLTSAAETHYLSNTDLGKYSEDEKSTIFKWLSNGNLDFNYFGNN